MAKVGPKPIFTEGQWQEIERRYLNGESTYKLSKELKVGMATLSRRGLVGYAREVREMAKQLSDTEQRFSRMPVSMQISARMLADELKAISMHLAGAAKFGSITAHRLSLIANEQVENIDPSSSLEENSDALRSVMAFTEGANKAASIGLNLLAANKETVKNANNEIDVTPDKISNDAIEASRVYLRMIGG